MKRFIRLVVILFACGPALAEDFLSCREMSDKDKQHWSQSKMDVITLIHDHLRPIHESLNATKSSSRFQEAEELVKAFDADTWLQRLRELEPKGAMAKHRTEMEFMFAFWIREKYLGLIARAASRTEQQQLKFFGTKLSPALRDRVAKYPSEPLITRISTYQCSNENNLSDIHSYRCGEPHIVVDVQLSPGMLCETSKAMAMGHIQFIVRLDPLRGPLIVDVERDSSRIYQSTLDDFLKMESKDPEDDIFEQLKRLAFFTPSDFNEIPGAGLLSLRDNSPATRIPASK